MIASSTLSQRGKIQKLTLTNDWLKKKLTFKWLHAKYFVCLGFYTE